MLFSSKQMKTSMPAKTQLSTLLLFNIVPNSSPAVLWFSKVSSNGLQKGESL
jgi:hypothetical protein